MEHLYQWVLAHQAICWGASTVITLVIGWALPNDKLLKIGFTLSQFIRRFGGEKLEKKIQEDIKIIEQGMESDDKK